MLGGFSLKSSPKSLPKPVTEIEPSARFSTYHTSLTVLAVMQRNEVPGA